jgi:hypothetical protein
VLVWPPSGQPSNVLICSAVAGQQVSSPMAGYAAERRSLLLSPVLARQFDSQTMQILLRTHSYPTCRFVVQATRPGKWQSKAAAAARVYRRCEERRAATPPQSYSLLFPPSSLYLVFIQSHLSPSLLFLSLLSGPSRAKRLWYPLCDLPRLKKAPAKTQPAGLVGVTVDMDEAQHPFEEMPPR